MYLRSICRTTLGFCISVLVFAIFLGGILGANAAPHKSTRSSNQSRRAAIQSVFVAGSNKRGFESLRKLASAKKGENVLVSPLCLLLNSGLLSFGLSGTSRAEYLRFLGLDEASLASEYRSVCQGISNKAPVVAAASCALAGPGIEFNSTYRAETKKILNADTWDKITNLDQAKSFIQKLTASKLDPALKIPHENCVALYSLLNFDGRWYQEFKTKDTCKRPFHLHDASTKDVSTMRRYFEESLKHFKSQQFEALRLPYRGPEGKTSGAVDGGGIAEPIRSESNYAMYLVLPAPKKSLYDFINSYDVNNLDALKWVENTGTLQVPRFKIDSTISQSILPPSAVTPDLANMLSVPKPVVSIETKQKLHLEFNERGTQAAALTETIGTLGMDEKPFDMRIDRPFLFILRDDKRKSVLFVGAVLDPIDSALTFEEADKEWRTLIENTRKQAKKDRLTAFAYFESLSEAAGFYQREKKFDRAEAVLKELISADKNPENKASNLQLLANLYVSKGDLNSAYELYQKVLVEMKADSESKGRFHQALSGYYRESLQDYQKLLKKMNKDASQPRAEEERVVQRELGFARKRFQKSDSHHNIAITLREVASFYERTDRPVEAEKYYKEALAGLKSDKEPEWELMYVIGKEYRKSLRLQKRTPDVQKLQAELAVWKKKGEVDDDAPNADPSVEILLGED